jgi:hypothetical protein
MMKDGVRGMESGMLQTTRLFLAGKPLGVGTVLHN